MHDRSIADSTMPHRLWLCATLALLPASIADAQQTFVHDSTGQTYRLIEATHFEMGAARPESFRGDHVDYNAGEDDLPIHPVILTKPFYLATTEVSVDQFRRFVTATGYKTDAERSDTGMVAWDPVNDPRNDEVKSSFRCGTEFDWQRPGIPQQGSHPVVGVSYHDAKAYCRWLSLEQGHSYRLPTEAEWECACRAGTSTHFSFGDAYRGMIQRHANVGNVELERASSGRVLLQWLIDVDNDPSDGNVFTAPVASYQPNPWGLFDLHGNVWEWCEDRYLDTYYSQFKRAGHRQVRPRAIDPLCDERWNEHGEWRVIRGGSWFVSPIQCRSGVRGVFEAGDAACYIGFRVVREASDEMVAQSAERHQKSEAALEALKLIARSVTEDRDGQIGFELRCDDLSDLVFRQLADLQYAVDVHLSQPGRLSADHLKQLGQIHRLTGLSISVGGPGISAQDFAPLADHPEIQSLQITGTVDLSDQLLDYLRDADQLISINLQGSKITDEGLSTLPRLTTLNTLHVASTQSSGAALSRFVGSPLREVSFARLTDDGAALLTTFPTIQNLNLQGCPISSRGLDCVASLRLLENLSLAGCVNLVDTDFQALSRLTRLVNLNLSDGDAGDTAVASLRQCNSLRDLTLGSDSLTDEGMKSICEIVALQSLTLTEQATKITDIGWADFWRLVNLQTLSIHAPLVSGQGFATLVELPKLRQLNLSNRGLNDAAMKHVGQMENLSELFIGSWQSGGPQGLTDEGLLSLANSARLKKVTLLRKGTKISDEAIEKLRILKPELKLDVR